MAAAMSVAFLRAAWGSIRWRTPMESTPTAEEQSPAMTTTMGSSIHFAGAGRGGAAGGAPPAGPPGAPEEGAAHPRHVPHVIAHVVGDDRGVPRVVLGNSRLDLADQVGAHVGRLGVDAASDPREERDGGGAHGEAVDHEGIAEDPVEDPEAHEPEACDGEPHDRPAVEGHGERLVAPNRLCRP